MEKRDTLLEELIAMAVKSIAENQGFNEIELTRGEFKVHLIKFSPTPYFYQPLPTQPWGNTQPE